MEIYGVIVDVNEYVSKQTGKDGVVVKVLSSDADTGTLGILKCFLTPERMKQRKASLSSWEPGMVVRVEAEEKQKGFSSYLNTTDCEPSDKQAILTIE